MRSRLPLGVAAAALVVAVLGTTPLSRAAITAAVPLAKRAYLADTAKNAIRVGNIKASRTPTAGMLVPLGTNGKFPPSVGAAGPAGQEGAKGNLVGTESPGTRSARLRRRSTVRARSVARSAVRPARRSSAAASPGRRRR